MKKVITFIMIILTVFCFSLPISAVEAETDNVITDDQIAEGISTAITEVDDVLGGIPVWEQAKDYIYTHLSSFVGIIMSISVIIFTVFSKHSFLPKIIKYCKLIITTISSKWDNNKDYLIELRQEFDKLRENVEKINSENQQLIKKVSKQADETEATQKEINGVYTEYVNVTDNNNAAINTVIAVLLMFAQQMEDVYQRSGITKAEADKQYAVYKNALDEINKLRGVVSNDEGKNI